MPPSSKFNTCFGSGTENLEIDETKSGEYPKEYSPQKIKYYSLLKSNHKFFSNKNLIISNNKNI